MEWHISIESLLEELCDEAQLRNKLHQQHFHWYANRNTRYTLPVVVLSVLSGSGNFVAGHFPLVEKWLIIGIGCVSILTSIISAVSQFLKLAQLSENHRVASLAWGKFYSSMRNQLRLRVDDRTDPKEFLGSICSEYDRLYEISPPLLNRFVDRMTRKLQGMVTNRFKIPFYLNGYKHMQTFTLDHEFQDNSLDDQKVEPTD